MPKAKSTPKPNKIPEGLEPVHVDESAFDLPEAESTPVHQCSECSALTMAVDDDGLCDFCATEHDV